MHRLSFTIAFVFVAILLSATPAHADFWDEIEKGFDKIVEFIHELGDDIEEETGWDLDWGDDIEHIIVESFGEICEFLGKEEGKDCHIACSGFDDSGLTDCSGRPIEKPIREEYVVGSVWIAVEDNELELDQAKTRVVLFGNREPASITTDVPSRPVNLIGARAASSNYGALVRFALGYFELRSLTREQRKMGSALERYASTVPLGTRVEVTAWFKNNQFVGVRKADEPQLLDGSAKNVPLRFKIYGTGPVESNKEQADSAKQMD